MPWLIQIGIAVVVLGVVAFNAGPGRLGLLMAAAAGCCACGAAYISVGRLMPRYFAPRLLIISYGAQLLALAGVAALGLPLGPVYHPFDVNAGDAPFRAVAAMLAIPAGAWLTAALWWFFDRSRRRDETQAAAEVARQRRVYLIVSAVLLLLYWPASLEETGAVGYVGRILATALTVAPFLAGHDSHNDRPLVVLWIVAIVVNTVVAVAAGTRQMAFAAATLFTVGYISALPRRRQLIVAACSAVLAVPMLQFAGALGVVRDEIGRGGLELLRPDRVREVFAGIQRQLTATDSASPDIALQSVGRVLAWTNVVVPMMTPEMVPYRGLEGLADEAAGTFQIARLSGVVADDLFDAGLATARARDYGFTVNANTSVEFTLAADGWSRGGVFASVLFAFIAAIAVSVGEFCTFKLHRLGAGVSSILALPVAKAALFDVNFVPLLATIRGMVLYMALAALMVAVVEGFRRMAHRRQQRSAAPRQRPASAGAWTPGAPPKRLPVKS